MNAVDPTPFKDRAEFEDHVTEPLRDFERVGDQLLEFIGTFKKPKKARLEVLSLQKATGELPGLDIASLTLDQLREQLEMVIKATLIVARERTNSQLKGWNGEPSDACACSSHSAPSPMGSSLMN